MQGHLRFTLSVADDPEDKVGLVCISRPLMAESKSERAVLAPCMAVPPAMEIFVFVGAGAGEAVLDGLPLFEEGIRSEISGPAAEGGGFEMLRVVGIGPCTASGLSWSANVFDSSGSLAL